MPKPHGLLLLMRKIPLKGKLISLFLKATGSPLVRPLIIFFFKHMNNLLPYERLIVGNYWEAVHHPKPNYPLHILILPKTSITSLIQAPKDTSGFYWDLFSLVQELIIMFDLEKRGYRLITNGGSNQSLPQWHWHLISENTRHI